MATDRLPLARLELKSHQGISELRESPSTHLCPILFSTANEVARLATSFVYCVALMFAECLERTLCDTLSRSWQDQ